MGEARREKAIKMAEVHRQLLLRMNHVLPNIDFNYNESNKNNKSNESNESSSSWSMDVARNENEFIDTQEIHNGSDLVGST